MKSAITNIIILAAGDIRSKFDYLKSSCSSPALIPINTKPTITYILEYYSQHKDEFCDIYIVVDEEVCKDVEASVHSFVVNGTAQVIGCQGTRNVNETLWYALSVIPPQDNTLVNVVTTVPTQYCQPQMYFVDSSLSENLDWSVFDGDAFHSKDSQIKKNGHAFTGIFNCPTPLLKACLLSSKSGADLGNIVYELQLGDAAMQSNMVKWIDCGHEENYYLAKRKLINSRSFNSVLINENGTIAKTSSNKLKLKNEVEFVNNLPKGIKHYFPRILDVSEADRFSYNMEYYGYPSVAELDLFWDTKSYVWKNFYKTIERILLHFAGHRSTYSIAEHRSFYYDKLISRLNSLRDQNSQSGAEWLDQTITLNGIELISVPSMDDFIRNEIDQLYNTNHHQIMHGDLCFNNILYDFPNDIIKLIDARGSFSDDKPTIYGDLKYDLAKLMHSAIYGYDFIVNGLYELVEKDPITYSLSIVHSKNHSLHNKGIEKLLATLQIDPQQIKFITSILFLSMTSLHDDDKRRQKTMFLTGLDLLNEYRREKTTHLP
jgi:hypothetical protein